MTLPSRLVRLLVVLALPVALACGAAPLWALGLDDALKVTARAFPTLGPQAVSDRLASMLVYMQEGDRLTVTYAGTTAVLRKQLNDITVEKLERATQPPATGNQGGGAAGPPPAPLSASATQAVAQAGLGLTPASLPKHLALLLANLRDGDGIALGYHGKTATFRRQGDAIVTGDGTGAAPTPAPVPAPTPTPAPAPTPAPTPGPTAPAGWALSAKADGVFVDVSQPADGPEGKPCTKLSFAFPGGKDLWQWANFAAPVAAPVRPDASALRVTYRTNLPAPLNGLRPILRTRDGSDYTPPLLLPASAAWTTGALPLRIFAPAPWCKGAPALKVEDVTSVLIAAEGRSESPCTGAVWLGALDITRDVLAPGAPVDLDAHLWVTSAGTPATQGRATTPEEGTGNAPALRLDFKFPGGQPAWLFTTTWLEPGETPNAGVLRLTYKTQLNGDGLVPSVFLREGNSSQSCYIAQLPASPEWKTAEIPLSAFRLEASKDDNGRLDGDQVTLISFAVDQLTAAGETNGTLWVSGYHFRTAPTLGTEQLTGVVEPAAPVAAAGPTKVTVRSALYGPAGDATRTKDVTVQVQRMVDAGTTAFLVADLATEGDPAYGTVKTLAVDYEMGGKVLQATGTDADLITLQVPTPTRPVTLDTDPATWPVAFEAVGSRGDPMLARTLLCPGYYAGLPEPMAAGLKINGGWTHTGLWLPDPVGTHGQLSLGFMPDANGWCLIVWPGGPGRGRVVDAGYNVIIRADGLEFRRDGGMVGTAKIDPPLAVGSDNTLTVTRNGGKITVDLNGKALFRCTDAQPLTGALTSRFGFGGAGCTVSDLKLRRPDLTADELAALKDVPLLPAATRQPTPNGNVVFQAPPADIKTTWAQAQPEAIDVRGDGLVLFNWNGNPAQWYPTALKGNVAYEVEFSFVPARWPAPAVGQSTPADHYMVNGCSETAFTAFLTFCDALPARADMLQRKPAFEWDVQLPTGEGAVGISRNQAGNGQSLTRMPYISLVAGRHYTARIERIGKRLRLFLDGAFITEVASPDVPDDSSPYFLGFGQWCSGNLVHAARAWQLP
jgi:hypothetical protein